MNLPLKRIIQLIYYYFFFIMSAIIIGSIVFLVIWVISAFFINTIATKEVNDLKLKREYTGMAVGLSFLGGFCMWLMWISVYMHQMHPLIDPILEHHA